MSRKLSARVIHPDRTRPRQLSARLLSARVVISPSRLNIIVAILKARRRPSRPVRMPTPRGSASRARYHREETTCVSNINSWLEDELYQQYLHDHCAVDESWQSVFEHHATPANGAAPKTAPAIEVSASEQLVP